AGDEVEHRIRVAVCLRRISTEDIKDSAPVVTAGRNLAVAVVIRLASRIRQPFHLETVCRSNQSEVRISVPSTDFKVQFCFTEACLEPILEMEFLVLPALPLNQLARFNRCNAPGKNFEAWLAGWHGPNMSESRLGVKHAAMIRQLA